jgi:hypothetical protein
MKNRQSTDDLRTEINNKLGVVNDQLKDEETERKNDINEIKNIEINIQ